MDILQQLQKAAANDDLALAAAAEIERQRVLLDRAADELERISMPEDDVDGLVVELRGHQQSMTEPK